MSPSLLTTAAATLLAITPALAGAPACALKPSGSIQPSVASGYHAQVVATGLSRPRGIAFDGAGNLLVVQAGKGLITAHSLTETNGCVAAGAGTNVTPSLQLNHGIALSADSKVLYASSTESAYGFFYNATSKTTKGQLTLVNNMTTDDHTTRTLLLSRKVPGRLVISRGSTSNLDLEAADIRSGHSQIKSFDLLERLKRKAPLDFNADGTILGWGLRNDVGVAEHPASGGIWSVENSADQIVRGGKDVHQDNPAEELNYLGTLAKAKSSTAKNYGYPFCLAAWKAADLPNNAGMTTGSQFAIDATPDLNNQTRTDAWCKAQAAPRLSFQAHMAPLDLKFNNSGTEAWIAFHGSWDRTDPAGYKVGLVKFDAQGEPVAPASSTTALMDVFGNANNAVCPGKCLRPVGLAIDRKGRLFVSSDASGEVYMITKK